MFFWTGGCVLAWLVLPVVRLGCRTELERIRRCQHLVSRGWRLFLDVARRHDLFNHDPRTTFASRPDGPVVVVANHPTLLDVTAIIAAWPELVCVAGGRYFRSPMVGRLLRDCGHIDAGDGGSMAGGAVIQKALERIEQGFSVLIFPEGTRSPVGALRRFRRGAFEIARRARVPVLPLVITCTPPTLMRGVPWYALPPRPSVLTVTPLPALDPMAWPDAAALTAHCKALLLAQLGARLAGAAPVPPGEAEGEGEVPAALLSYPPRAAGEELADG